MAQRPRFNHKRQKPSRATPRATVQREAPAVYEKKPPVVYGQAFVVMEDQQRNTFAYARGAWAPYAMSIAECRQECQVKELPQKVNGMTRYEIRCPETMAS